MAAVSLSDIYGETPILSLETRLRRISFGAISRFIFRPIPPIQG